MNTVPRWGGVARVGLYGIPGKTASTFCAYRDGCRDAMRNGTGTGGTNWHKADTAGSGSVRGDDAKENAAPGASGNGVGVDMDNSNGCDDMSGRCLRQAENAVIRRENSIDAIVLDVLARPDGAFRNGRFCFTRRSRLAREAGLPREVFNASVRRLMAAGICRVVWSRILDRQGIEIDRELVALDRVFQ